MAALQPAGPVVAGARSLEVRWIVPGRLETAMAGWFARFPAEEESRDDLYLLHPRMPGLSVKVRAGNSLEVKVYHGSLGVLEVAGRARGRLEYWQKWSFLSGPPDQGGTVPAGWRLVRKTRLVSRFPLADGHGPPRGGGAAGQAGCAVELARVRASGRDWWSLGFEAIGPPGLIRGGLDRAAALVFALPLPGGRELGAADCCSYTEWLLRQAEPSP